MNDIFYRNIKYRLRDMVDLFDLPGFIELSINVDASGNLHFYVETLKNGYLSIFKLEEIENRVYAFKDMNSEDIRIFMNLIAVEVEMPISGKSGSKYIYYYLMKFGVRISFAKNRIFGKNEGIFVNFRSIKNKVRKLESFGFDDESKKSLLDIIKNKKTFAVVGATSCGKTSLMNTLISLLDQCERIIVIQDVHELLLNSTLSVNFQLESFVTGDKEAMQNDFENAMNAITRMNPSRIVLGELSITNTIPTMLSLNTGHHGSFFSMHGNSAKGGMDKLALNLALAGMRMETAKELIKSTIDFFIYLTREKDKFKIMFLEVKK